MLRLYGQEGQEGRKGRREGLNGAVLIIVFAPLDMIVQGKPLTGRFALATMTIVTLLLGAGVALEVKQWKTS